MFRMSTDSFDGPSRRFPRRRAISRQCMTIGNAFPHQTAVQPVAACRQSPYLHKPAVDSYCHCDVVLIMTSCARHLAVPMLIMTSCSLWHHSRPGRDTAGTGRLYRLLVMMSFSLWRHWRHANHYGRTYVRRNERTDTLPRYRDLRSRLSRDTWPVLTAV